MSTLLYIARHGDAGNPHLTFTKDSERELSDEGRKKTMKMGEVLTRMKAEIPDVIIASPLIRAQQTAELLREHFAPKAKMETSAALVPEAEMEVTMAMVEKYAKDFSTIMIAGHEPHHSSFVSVLLSGTMRPVIDMKKSGIVLLELTNLESPRMRGILKFYLVPKLANLI